jgi:putative phosphoribosyl transferase
MTRFVDPMNLSVSVGEHVLHADLAMSREAEAAVIFAHGSGSSRFSPRNRSVAQALQQSGFATLLVDLLTMEEERVDQRTLEFRFNIDLLAERLVGITDWVRQQQTLSHLHLGYFGASTGAAAALIAASRRPHIIDAIVSRGGRPDLAGAALSRVAAPTLLIVGERDYEVLGLNREAARVIKAPTEIKIVTGATHLFEEVGALEQVSSFAAEWFRENLSQSHAA